MSTHRYICLLAALSSLACAQSRSKEDRKTAVKAIYESYRSKHPGVRVAGGDIANPRVISKMDPKFPPNFLAEPKRPTIVIVYAVVSESGSVIDPIIVGGSDPRLNSYILEAIKSWRYEPAQVSGKPISVFQTIAIETFQPSA